MKPVTLAAPYKITKPGFYLMPEPEYRRDPCPAPSLNQSLAKVLLERSPAHARVAHPKLNPNWEEDDATKYDIGNIAHRLVLGRGKQIDVLSAEFVDWRKKEAQAQREASVKNGMLAVLSKDFEVGQQMAREALACVAADPALQGTFDPNEGCGEVVAVWKEGDLWFRIMLDWLSADLLTYTDFKTTSTNAAPHAVSVRSEDGGWDIQGAFAERALDALDPKNAGRRKFHFVVQENEEPFALTATRLSESSLHLGRRKVAAAIQLWQRAVQENRWPSYPSGIHPITPPSYAETRWLGREMAMHDAGLIDFSKDPVLGATIEGAPTENRRDIMRAG